MARACDALCPSHANRGNTRGCIAAIETASRTEPLPLGAAKCAESKPPLSSTEPHGVHAADGTTATAPAAEADDPCASEECALAEGESPMRQGPDEGGDETLQRNVPSPHAPLVDGKHAVTSCCVR